MATHSRFLAWRIQWTEEPGGLQSKGLQRVRHDGSDLAFIRAYYTISRLQRICCHIFTAISSYLSHPLILFFIRPLSPPFQQSSSCHLISGLHVFKSSDRLSFAWHSPWIGNFFPLWNIEFHYFLFFYCLFLLSLGWILCTLLSCKCWNASEQSFWTFSLSSLTFCAL